MDNISPVYAHNDSFVYTHILEVNEKVYQMYDVYEAIMKKSLAEKKPFYLVKQLSVSDAHNWDGGTSILCDMTYVSEKHKVHFSSPTIVRISFFTVSGTKMYRDFDYFDKETNWQYCLEHYFNKIPKRVSVSWLDEHGYIPFGMSGYVPFGDCLVNTLTSD